MRLWFIPALIWLNLCGTSGGRVGEAPGEVHQGQGWSVRLPAPGATVKAEASRVSVDATDFSRWFDVRWDEAWGDLSVPVRNIAMKECDPVVWDEPVVTETSWTASALCTRRERFEWLIGRVEKHGDRALVFFYVANRDFVAYEDAWVDFSATVATIGAGDTPPEPPDAADLRRRIREAAKNVGPSLSPLPGGRVMSPVVVPALEPIWTLRAATPPPPATFDGSVPPAPATDDTDRPTTATDTDTPTPTDASAPPK